jgi:pimeloyl-ACP methyl ester carboxylesterase
MPTAQVNGVEIWYQLTGEGPYLLQVPGAVSGHEGYALVTEAMSPHFTVIDFDPRGYGASSRPRQRYTFDVWADDMTGLLDAIGVERAHVHGGSMGSLVALRYAARHAERVDGLVLSGCSACSDRMAALQFSVWKALARAYGCGSRELAEELCSKAVSRRFLDGPAGDGLVEAVMDVVGRMVDDDVFCDACDAMIETDLRDDVRTVVAPTLVLVGDEDQLSPAAQGPRGAGGAWIYEHLGSAAVRELVVLEGSGHANLMDNAERSNAAVIEFLQRVGSRPGARRAP